MAIDFKTISADTTFGSGAFLFGADSQSASEPSLYSESTVFGYLLGLANTWTNNQTINTGEKTASAPILDMTQTWNNGAVTFTGIKANITDTASASGSLLMDLQVGGSSKFKVSKTSQLLLGGAAGDTLFTDGVYAPNWLSLGGTSNTTQVQMRSGIFVFRSDVLVSWSNDTSFSTQDLFLTRKAAASLRLGAADAASPVAQTLGVQSVVAGTTNTAGANFTIAGSQGTGSGAGGSIVFQVAPAGSSGTAQNALATAWQISGAGHLLAGTDNTYDIGTTGATRPRSIYVGTSIRVEGDSSYIRLESPDIVCNRAGTAYMYNNNASGSLRLGTTNAAKGIFIDTSATSTFDGAIRFSTDNTYDIGANGANRPRSIYTGSGIVCGGDLQVANGLIFSAKGYLYAQSDGVFTLYDYAVTSFGRLQFGGTTSSFPALKRSTTSLQARLADDSGFTNIQGKLTTETAYTAGAPTATGYIVLYDSTGTAYKVPAEAL